MLIGLAYAIVKQAGAGDEARIKKRRQSPSKQTKYNDHNTISLSIK